MLRGIGSGALAVGSQQYKYTARQLQEDERAWSGEGPQGRWCGWMAGEAAARYAMSGSQDPTKKSCSLFLRFRSLTASLSQTSTRAE